MSCQPLSPAAPGLEARPEEAAGRSAMSSDLKSDVPGTLSLSLTSQLSIIDDPSASARDEYTELCYLNPLSVQEATS